jgi:hypothetical protein
VEVWLLASDEEICLDFTRVCQFTERWLLLVDTWSFVQVEGRGNRGLVSVVEKGGRLSVVVQVVE